MVAGYFLAPWGPHALAQIAPGKPLRIVVAFAAGGPTDILTHIPYNGAAPALTALLSGEVSLLFNNPITALPHTRSGKARVLAVTSAKRSAAAPKIPTLAEAGVPGVEVGSWSAVLAPAGTSGETIMRLHNEIKRIVGTAEVRSRLVAEGTEPIGAGPDELAAFIKSELPKWAKVVAQSKARID
jgi:tripartite-type tricarboxylate transporter receptor subunit TctC